MHKSVIWFILGLLTIASALAVECGPNLNITDSNGCDITTDTVLNFSNSPYNFSNNTYTAINIRTDYVTLDCNNSVIYYGFQGIWIYDAANVTVKNCNLIAGNMTQTWTLRIEDAPSYYGRRDIQTNNSIFNNHFKGNLSVVYTQYTDAPGLWGRGWSGTSIHDNILEGGVDLMRYYNSTLTNNILNTSMVIGIPSFHTTYYSDFCFFSYFGYNVSFYDNTLYLCPNGFILWASLNQSIINNHAYMDNCSEFEMFGTMVGGHIQYPYIDINNTCNNTCSWLCTGYEECIKPDPEANCIIVNETNQCNLDYFGDYSEFEGLTCSYPMGGGGGSWPEDEEITEPLLAAPEQNPSALDSFKQLLIIGNLGGMVANLKELLQQYWYIGLIILLLIALMMLSRKKKKRRKK